MVLSCYLSVFRSDPAGLSSRQRTLVWTAAIAAALSRLYALSKSIWDWDEALFCLGVRHYDVVLHHPHPPGFPLFIAAAKLVRPVAGSDFRALQIVTVAGAIALLPALFALGRELRMPFTTTILGSLLCVFFPNVWFYGGTAFSDLPATALVAGACVLLLRGCRSRWSYLLGALVLGVSIAFRPQNLLIAAAPALLATWFRAREHWPDVAAAAAIGAVVLVISYGGAALASESVNGFFDAMRAQRDYVLRVDSYHNLHRTPLRDLAPGVFIAPMRGGRLAHLTGLLAVAGLVAAIVLRRWPALCVFVLFLPFNVFAWLMLDEATLARYAVGYVAMHAFLAADAVAVAASLLRRLSARAGAVFEAALLLAMTISFARWTVPALREVRREPSPPVAAMLWITEHVPHGSEIVVFDGLGPFASYFLKDYNVAYASSRDETPPGPHTPNEFYVSDGATSDAAAHTFVRPHGRIWEIARRRYFEAFARPVTETVAFGSGWHDVEEVAGGAWRWMAGRAEIELSAIPSGRAELSLRFYVPLDALPAPPVVTIDLNGSTIGRIVCRTGEVSKICAVPARADTANRIVLSTDKIVNPLKQGLGNDPRDLGLQLRMLGWRPLPP